MPKGPVRKPKFSNPIAPYGELEKPDYIADCELASQEWDRMLPVLDQMGLMSPSYHAIFSCYCTRFARWVEAEKAVIECGISAEGRESEKRSPYVITADKAFESLLKVSKEFGLTPASRTSVHISEQKADEFENWITDSGSVAEHRALDTN